MTVTEKKKSDAASSKDEGTKMTTTTPTRDIKAALFHPVCLIGSVIATTGLCASVTALVFDLWSDSHASPYEGLLTFMLFPAVLITGLTIVAIGLFYQRRRARRLAQKNLPIGPPLDWKNPRHRLVFSLSVVTSIIFACGSIVGALRTYQYTESVSFCGALCHEPMNPQAVAHANSPHANVACVECHVGHEVKSYVDAKVSGMRQVYQVATNSYHRPIKMPAEAAQKTAKNCLNCHWTETLQESQSVNRTRFGYDAANSKRHIKMMLRNDAPLAIGEDPSSHWHTRISGRMRYWFTDDFAQDIARVEIRSDDGSVRVFDKMKKGERLHADRHVEDMDMHEGNCLTCHNRPAHNFKSPDELLDRALSKQDISNTLPFIKRIGIRSMSRLEATKEECIVAIGDDVNNFYSLNFPSIATSREQEIETSIDAIQEAFSKSNFPSMNVTGSSYPNNIGHRAFPGCLRCHNGDLVDSSQQPIESRCSLCHVFFEESRVDSSLQEIPANASALHPFKEKDHGQIACWTCHTGHTSPQDACAECHAPETESPIMNLSCSTCHSPEHHEPKNSQCASCHPSGNSPMHAIVDHADCNSCHLPHKWEVSKTDTCKPCHEKRKCEDIQTTDPQRRSCIQCHSFDGMESTLHGLNVPWDYLEMSPHKKVK